MEEHDVTGRHLWRRALELDPTLGVVSVLPKHELKDKVKEERVAYAKAAKTKSKHHFTNAYYVDEANVYVKVQPWKGVGRRGRQVVQVDSRLNPNSSFYGVLRYVMCVQAGVGIVYLALLSSTKGLKHKRRYKVSGTYSTTSFLL